jgi:hypothetical protein
VTVTVTATKTAKAPAPVTVTKTAQAEAPPAAAATPAGGGSDGPVPDGTYLIGTDLQAGNYKCSDASETPIWSVKDFNGELTSGDFGSVARVPATGYTIDLLGCNGQWEKIG